MLIDENFVSEVVSLDGSGGSGGVEVWERPSDWLPMPDVLATEQKVVGLVAITNTTANHLSIQCQGAYTVDWGDGSSPANFTSGSTASKNIAWGDISGSTLTTRGYRQALVIITPQSGQNLTLIDFKISFSGIGYTVDQNRWLDLIVSAPDCGVPGFSSISSTPRMRWLERIQWISKNSSNISGDYLFFELRSLQKVELPPGSWKFNNVVGLWRNCRLMRDFPEIDTSICTDMSLMHSGCTSAVSIPQYDFSSATTLENFAASCVSLLEYGDIIAPNCTQIGGIFNGCSCLSRLGSLSFGAPLVEPFNCIVGTLLETITLFNTSGVTSMFSFISTNLKLREVPAFDLSATTSANVIVSHTSIQRSLVTGYRYTHSYTNCALSRDAIVEIFNNLGTAVGAQTITVTGCPGAASLSGADLAIATGKGWTVAT